MAFKTLSLFAAAASVVLGSTPAGFVPATQNSLVVAYGNVLALDGAETAQSGECCPCLENSGTFHD